MTTGRFAPTPSGGIHLGNVLCCLLAYCSARSQGGRFLMRVEDVDVPRCPRSAGEQVVRDLRYLGFDWDEPVLWQSERGAVYDQALERLKAAGLVYPCFCTRAELHREAAPNLGETRVIYSGACAHLTPAEIQCRLKERPPAWRFRVPDETIRVSDRLQGDYAERLPVDCGDFVLKRSDGLIAYQLAVVVDDALSGVTEVVRGRDLLPSTPGQISLQRSLGYPAPGYAHIPLLLAPDGRRLAKRDHDLDVSALSHRFRPGQIVGMLAAAAGLIDHPAEVSPAELAREFNWDRIPRCDIRLPAIL